VLLKYLFKYFFKYFHTILKIIAPNVKVVYDVSGVAIKELRSGSTGTKKCGGDKNPQRRLRRLGFFGA
jgi:hypothetical protein